MQGTDLLLCTTERSLEAPGREVLGGWYQPSFGEGPWRALQHKGLDREGLETETAGEELILHLRPLSCWVHTTDVLTRCFRLSCTLSALPWNWSFLQGALVPFEEERYSETRSGLPVCSWLLGYHCFLAFLEALRENYLYFFSVDTDTHT